MKYIISIFDNPTGWVKNEETTNRSYLYDLRQQAAQKARECVKFMGKENTAGKHFVYYYEMPATNWKGEKTGDIDVYVYMLPYMCDEATFDRFITDSRPDFVGAIHGNNLSSKFFKS